MRRCPSARGSSNSPDHTAASPQMATGRAPVCSTTRCVPDVGPGAGRAACRVAGRVLRRQARSASRGRRPTRGWCRRPRCELSSTASPVEGHAFSRPVPDTALSNEQDQRRRRRNRTPPGRAPHRPRSGAGTAHSPVRVSTCARAGAGRPINGRTRTRSTYGLRRDRRALRRRWRAPSAGRSVCRSSTRTTCSRR